MFSFRTLDGIFLSVNKWMFSVILVNVFKNKLSLAEKKPVAGKQPLNSIV